MEKLLFFKLRISPFMSVKETDSIQSAFNSSVTLSDRIVAVGLMWIHMIWEGYYCTGGFQQSFGRHPAMFTAERNVSLHFFFTLQKGHPSPKWPAILLVEIHVKCQKCLISWSIIYMSHFTMQDSIIMIDVRIFSAVVQLEEITDGWMDWRRLAGLLLHKLFILLNEFLVDMDGCSWMSYSCSWMSFYETWLDSSWMSYSWSWMSFIRFDSTSLAKKVDDVLIAATAANSSTNIKVDSTPS